MPNDGKVDAAENSFQLSAASFHLPATSFQLSDVG